MPDDDDIDFDAFMRDRGIPRGAGAVTGGAGPGASAGDAGTQAQLEGLQRALKGARILREQARQALEATKVELADARVQLAAAQAERDLARTQRAAVQAERDEARVQLAAAQAEHGDARTKLAAVQAERDALAKECRALQRKVTAAPAESKAQPSGPTLREALSERGAEDEESAALLLLALLDRDPAMLLDGLQAPPALAERWLAHVALVCERPECQPDARQAVVVHVEPERCEVCGGSDIKVAFELLLRASRVAGVTRLLIVGGSPPYHTQLKELSRGTDLKLDLVSGRSKPGKRRARSNVERVVIWGATILDHGTSAAYEDLGDRLIRVTHRGISGMLREVAEALG